mmetsp:Transcript_21012/g.58174  ORF Transcript_21012/g.58174 Transcript_21012/m.58174 type:complete len:129 (-) Transcript_21012:1434-1820(-)
MSSTTDTDPAEPSLELLREQEIDTAAAILSLNGPCRIVGDVYLTCVATAGLGQCRHLRASFEDCAKSTKDASRQFMQQTLVHQIPACAAMAKEENNTTESDQLFCVAQTITQDLFQRAFASPPPNSNN